MRRILVTGNAGSGKTSVAQLLSAKTTLAYIGLDGIVWKPGWSKTPALERQQKEHAIAATPTWVVDGVSLPILRAADTVVLLDYPRCRCFWRVLCRNVPYLFRSRPGLPERCPEILIVPALIKIIWRFPRQVRPGILRECHASGKRLVHIRTDSELRQFLISRESAPITIQANTLGGSASCGPNNRGEQMELQSATDEEAFALAEPIMDNLIAGSDAVDFDQHTRDFTDRARAKLTPELLECVCRDSQSERGMFGSREPVAVFRRPGSVALVWRQRFTKAPGDYVAEMVLVAQNGRILVDHVMVF